MNAELTYVTSMNVRKIEGRFDQSSEVGFRLCFLKERVQSDNLYHMLENKEIHS